jgi:predicted ribosomally synthesized peptide with SipW-like signal peptide
MPAQPDDRLAPRLKREDMMKAMRFGSDRRKNRLGAKLALTALVLGLLGTIAGLGTWAAFSATTQNPGNSFASGTVALGDDDSGTAMLSLSGAKPGDSDSSCIVVDYSGSLPSGVTLYGSTGGTGLAQYLNLTVTRGTKSSAFDGCGDFVADGPNYIGAGAGVIFNGTLQGYPDNYGAGITDAPGSAENWTTGETHAYKFAISVQNDNAAQGLNADQTFVWEARNN